MNLYEIRLLSSEFYKDYNLSKYPEMEEKTNRPFLVMLVEIENNIFAIPFRTNIKHNYCYNYIQLQNRLR